MGTFLLEKISKEFPFADEVKEELQKRVIDTLLEFGECALEQISLYGKKVYIYKRKTLEKTDDQYIMEYNRFEKCTWEATVMDVSLEHFQGLRDISSKVGYRQHYMAMAVTRVLCECYSSGHYCVYGDIKRSTIIECLAYIGKKYGFELVEKFIEARTDLERMAEHENYEELYWGARGHEYYFRRYEDMDTDEWINYMERNFRSDIDDVEAGADNKYCGTGIYLASVFMNCLCRKELAGKMKWDKEHLLAVLKELIQMYYIDAVEDLKKTQSLLSIDFSQYSELKKYRQYFEKMPPYIYISTVCDKGMFYRSVNNVLHHAKRKDSAEILAEFRKMLDEMVPSKDQTEEMQEDKLAWQVYHILKKDADQEDVKKDCMDSIIEISKKSDDIRSRLISSVYLRELMLSDFSAVPMSKELDSFLMDIFSEARQTRFEMTIKERDRSGEANNAAGKLLNMMEELQNEHHILLSSELFYQLLERSFSDQRAEFIDKINFYLKDLPELDQKEAFLWVLQENNLGEKYAF